MRASLARVPELLGGFLAHPTTWVTASAWVSANLLKVALVRLRRGVWDWRRFYGSGGMPSSHTAFVAALTACIGLSEGLESPVFTLALGLGILTSVDAAGLRQAAGHQAASLNAMMQELYQGRATRPPRLKEMLGHTGPQVLAGALLGAGMALLLYPRP